MCIAERLRKAQPGKIVIHRVANYQTPLAKLINGSVGIAGLALARWRCRSWTGGAQKPGAACDLTWCVPGHHQTLGASLPLYHTAALSSWQP